MEAVESWVSELDALMERIGPRFARSEARERAKAYVKGLLSDVERKNGWQLAEAGGDKTPYGVQQFLYRAVWDADAVRDDVRDYVIEHLGDEQAVVIVDETGFLKKGTRSAGVKRQYSGTAGRIENCQIGVFLAYATPKGHTFLDRALFLPEEWTDDRERARAAGIPDEVESVSKPKQAWAMLKRVVEHQVPFAWVTGDSIYGDYRSLRLWLEELPKGYVLAVSAKEYVPIGLQPCRVGDLLAGLPADGWRRVSAGKGAKGPRWYDWYRITLNDPLQEGWERWLLVRRSLSDPHDLAASACFAPKGTSLETLVQVAGSRWAIEACFEEAKGEVGLDQYEVRSWTGWYRHITLACLAHAFLTVMRASANEALAQIGGPPFQPSLPGSLASFKRRRGLSSA
jgi:SRSO17 transposase